MIKLLLYLVVIFLISCNGSRKELIKNEYEVRWEKQKALDSLNRNEALNLSIKHNAITNEGNEIKFTYQIQKLCKENTCPISVIGYIADVSLSDSNYILQIHGTFGSHKYFGKISISPEQFQDVDRVLSTKSKLHQTKGCFIFIPATVKSSTMLTIDSEVLIDDYAKTADEANANASSELTYDFQNVLLLFKGNMVDLYLYKTLENDDD